MSDQVDRRNSGRVEPGAGHSFAAFLGERHPVRNISASGILLEPYLGASTVGQFLKMTVSIRDSGMDFTFGAEATVVRVDQRAVAMRFFSILPEGKARLMEYFSRKLGSNLFNVKA